jgi:hypothetical protein
MGRTDEGGINLFVSQQFDEFVAESLFQSQRDQRKSFLKRTNDAWDKWMKRTRRRDPDADTALLTARCAPGRFKCVIELRKDRPGIIEKGPPGIGQLDPARLTAKELHVEFAFDRLDPLTKRRLLHAKPLGGPRDVSFLGNGDEIPEMPQLHFSISGTI